MIKTITIDGRQVAVEAHRFAAFDGAKTLIAQAISAALPPTMDANEVLAFTISQLAYTEAQAFEKLYQPMQFRELVPVETAGGWNDTIRYELIDYAGQGKRISASGDDIPMSDVQVGEKSFPVVTGGMGYRYTYEEMQKSALLRTPLPTARLQAAMTGAERHLNQVGLYGEASSGLTGLFNNANVPQGAAPTGSWATATPAQILADINQIIMNVHTNTAHNDFPTDILLPPASMALLLKPRSDNSDKTILSYIKENNYAKLERNIDINFKTGYGLNTAGSGGTKRMLAYVKRTDRVKMHIPQELNFLAPQQDNLAIKVPGVYRYSGVEFRYPKSAYYMDGL